MLNAIARSTTKLLRRSYTNQMKIRNKTIAIATASNYNREYHWNHLNYIAKSLYSTENSTENVKNKKDDNNDILLTNAPINNNMINTSSTNNNDISEKKKKKKKKKKRKKANLPPEDPSLLEQGTAALRQTPTFILRGGMMTVMYTKDRIFKPSLLRDDWIYVKTGVMEFLHHHWTGLKLLWLDVKTATSILSRVVRGHSLTRRERKLLLRTTSDIFRLIPFSFFVIIPAMEFLLPVFIKIFPNMLPSTFQDKLKKEEDMKKLLRARLNLATFIQDTVEELASDIKNKEGKPSDGEKDDLQLSASKLLEMIESIQEGEKVDSKQLMELTHIFKDSITLDRLPRAQLVAMCRFMSLRTFGADSFLRYQLRSKLGQLQRDDQQILWEGIDSLNLRELKEACQERGMRATGMLKADYRRQLQGWLDLSVKRSVPTSLLILSRSLLITTEEATDIAEEGVAVEALKESISALDEEVITQAVLEAAAVGEDEEDDLKEKTVLRELKIEELKLETELVEDEREELEDAIEDLEELQEEAAEAEKLLTAEQAEKELQLEMEDYAKPLLSTDGGAKVDTIPKDGKIFIDDRDIIHVNDGGATRASSDDKVTKKKKKKQHAIVTKHDDDDKEEKDKEIYDGEVKDSKDKEEEEEKKVLDTVLTKEEIKAIETLTDKKGSAVAEEREILDELKAKVKEAEISHILEEEREQAEKVWIDEDEFVDDDEIDEEADEVEVDDEEKKEAATTTKMKEKILDLVQDKTTPKEKMKLELDIDKEKYDTEYVDEDIDEEEEEDDDDDGEEEEESMIDSLTTKKKKKEDLKRRKKLQTMVEQLETQIEKVDETVGDKFNVIHVLDLGSLGEFIPTEELKVAIIEVLNTHNDEEEADAIIEKLDLNKDGFVDVNDLRRLQTMEATEMEAFIESFTKDKDDEDTKKTTSE